MWILFVSVSFLIIIRINSHLGEAISEENQVLAEFIDVLNGK
jgi:hypothetical protein